MFNSFGNIFRLTSFGESHGKGIGGVVDGLPPGIVIDMDFIQNELNRRRPGQSDITTSRQEPDQVEFFSGIFEGKSTGCPIGFIVWNKNQHSSDYKNLQKVYRPSHADYTYTVWLLLTGIILFHYKSTIIHILSPNVVLDLFMNFSSCEHYKF